MNEEVVNKANELLLQMIADVNGVRDFVVEQAPDVVQQLLLWHWVYSFIIFLAFLVGGLGLCVGSLLACRKASISRNGEAHLFHMAWMVPLMLSPAFFIEGLVWVKIELAPKLYLLEYAAKLVN